MKETIYNAFGQLSPFRKKEINILILLILFSIFIRIPTIFIFGDTSLENEWKIMVDNLIEHKKFSLRSFDKFFLPNLFMPPLYAFYLYFFSIFNLEEQNYIQLILLSQVLLSSISVAVFYKLNKIFFSKLNKKDLEEKTKEAEEVTRENVSLKDVVGFAVSNFNKINKKKIIVIQYGDKSKNSSKNEKLEELRTIKLLKEHLLLEISKYKISVIDMIGSFELFSEDEKRMLWFDHYAPKGNEIVCNEIVKFINTSKFYKTEP